MGEQVGFESDLELKVQGAFGQLLEDIEFVA